MIDDDTKRVVNNVFDAAVRAWKEEAALIDAVEPPIAFDVLFADDTPIPVLRFTTRRGLPRMVDAEVAALRKPAVKEALREWKREWAARQPSQQARFTAGHPEADPEAQP